MNFLKNLPLSVAGAATISLAILFGASSCSKSSSGGPSSDANMSFTANGSAFSTKRVIGIDTLQTVYITAYFNNGKDSGTVNMTFPDTLDLGSYSEDKSDYEFLYMGTNTQAGYYGEYYVIYDDNNFNAHIPVLTISSWNRAANTISGSFSGNTFTYNVYQVQATDSAVVTGGKFTCTYSR